MSKKTKLIRLIYLISIYTITLVIAGLIFKNEIVQWPFRQSYNLKEQINIIFTYIPLFSLSLILLFLFHIGEINRLWSCQRPAFIFYVCLFISLSYAEFLLSLGKHGFFFIVIGD